VFLKTGGASTHPGKLAKKWESGSQRAQSKSFLNGFMQTGSLEMKRNPQRAHRQLEKSGWLARNASVMTVTMTVAMLAAGGAARAAQAQSSSKPADNASAPYQETTEDYNRRLADITRNMAAPGGTNSGGDYRIGADDQLDIAVLEAPELDRAPRVSATGEISLALVGTVRAAGLTTQQLQLVIEELLRRNYINEPHVSVQVKDMQSHPVSVFGAVKKPGVFQIRGPKTVVELLSMAEGLDVDAGDLVIIEHRGEQNPAAPATTGGGMLPPEDFAAPSAEVTGKTIEGLVLRGVEPSTEQVDLKKLLATGDPSLNLRVYPGDVVKVPRAELVYVVGEVGRPGGFELKSNENISILQAIALAQGLTHTSAASKARIIRTSAETGKREEIHINLSKILAGQAADQLLEPRDIVFVPNSVGRTALYRGVDAALTIGAGVAVYRW
jgi:polysaccharide biosynthesis/export protein